MRRRTTADKRSMAMRLALILVALSAVVRDTVAIQTGEDLRTASTTFHWGQDRGGSPASFFPERVSKGVLP
jgi:hypothetical protein